MPFALVIIGLVLVVTGAKDTYQQFGRQVSSDFTGEGNFTWWLVSLGAVGSLGYIPALRPFSRMFLVLIVIAMVIKNGGFFDQLTSALQAGPIAPAKNTEPTQTTGESMVLGQVAAGVLDANKIDPHLDVIAQAQAEAGAKTSRNFGDVLKTVFGVFLPSPAY